jgi:hypothetical protein
VANILERVDVRSSEVKVMGTEKALLVAGSADATLYQGDETSVVFVRDVSGLQRLTVD